MSFLSRVCLYLCAILPAAIGQVSQTGQWTALQSWPFIPVSVAHYSDGRIVAWASTQPTGFPAGPTFTYAAVMDPATGQITNVNNTAHDMFCAGLATTGDGRIIASGGGNDVRSTSTIGMIPRWPQSWSRLADMLSGRWYNSTLTLSNGNLLTMWGRSGGTLTEIFDQNTNAWTPLSGVTINSGTDPADQVDDDHNWFPHLHHMPNGKILMAGPLRTMRWIDYTGLGSWQDIGNRTPDGARHRKLGASAQYLPGKILYTGGRDDRYSPGVWNSAVVIDATGATPVTTATAPMNYQRAFHYLVILPNGEVMAVGGNTSGVKFSDSGGVTVPEIWNPSTGTWRTVAPMATPRGYHMTAILLRDGRVFVGGGGLCDCVADHQNGQIYSPGYLFNANGTAAARPTIDLVSPDLKPGITIGLKGSDDITGFRLIRLQATTHGVNSDQRYVPVNYTKAGAGSYSLTLDGNQNTLLPGLYWLFALNAAGTPSIGYPVQMFTPSTWPGGSGTDTNLAKGKAATQSSTDTVAAAGRAVDGNTNGDFYQNSVAQTLVQAQPHWSVDLGAPAAISSIRLYNRTDCCSYLLSNFHVFVSNQPITGATVAEAKAQAGVIDLPYPGQAPALAVIPANVTGRYVRVQLEGTAALPLAEVEVMGTVITNLPPVVVLTSPQNGATATAPGSFVLSATAADPENDLAKVEFYQGTTKLGESTAAPFTYNWTNVPVGTYTVKARALDTAGLFAEATASVTVNPVQTGNRPPVVSILDPVDGATMPGPAAITVDVSASDPDGNLARVELWQGAAKLGELTTAPFLFAVNNLNPGTYAFTAKAVDTLASTVSASITVRVLSRQLQSLKGVPVPEPSALAAFVKNRSAAVALGKALFWDVQVSSDGTMACASCHFQAGADPRLKNQMNPGTFRTGNPAMTFDSSRTGSPNGPNYTVKPGDFPRHVLSDPLDPNSAVVYQSKDVMGSHGVYLRNFVSADPAGLEDACATAPDAVFGTSRRVTGRNAPSVLNAVFNIRNFWDGRANATFNGVDSFGPRNTSAVIYRGTPPAPVAIALDNASLASQAVVAPLNSGEMSCAGRTWPEIGKRLLKQKALGRQSVAASDSVLGAYAAAGGAKGLSGTYEAMVQAAFFDDLHLSTAGITVNGKSYRQIEVNFSLFFGLAVQMYEATLVSDQAPIDSYFANYPSIDVGNAGALPTAAITGMNVFLGKGRCVSCHHGPELTNAGTPAREAAAIGALISRMRMGNGVEGAYDLGFYNLGVRPAAEDPGLGSTDPFGNPLSFTRQAKIGALRDQITVQPCTFEMSPCVPLDGATRDVVDGAFKTPSLRNVSLTGPYFHNGSAATLEDVVDFYDRGGNATGTTSANSTGMGANPTNAHADIRPLALTAAEKSALVTFLKTALLDDRVLYERAPFDHPELPLPNGQTGTVTDMVLIPAVGSGGRTQPVAAFSDVLGAANLGYPVYAPPPLVALTAPVSGDSIVAPATVAISATVATAQGTITKVEFYNGATLLGTATAAPYGYNWTSVAAGSYTITAKVYGSNGTTATSAEAIVTVTAPVGSALEAGHWPLDAVASGVTADTSANNNPGVVSGPYVMSAGAVGQAIQLSPSVGGITTQRNVIDPKKSFTVSIWVNPTNTNGTQTYVSMPATSVSNFYLQLGGWLNGAFVMDMYPQDSTGAADYVAGGTTIPVPNTWYHLVGVYDATAKEVRLYVNGQREGLALAPAGGFANTGPLAFGYSKYAGVRYDGNDARIDDVRVFSGALTAADILQIYNEANGLPKPVVALTAPAVGASFTAPATVAMTASASTAAGTIAKVEFYNGGVLLGTAAAAPYTYSWSNVAAGSYAITAKAYGSNGTTADSAPVAVTVTAAAAPVVALTAPAAGAGFTAPATVAIAATATTTQGTITKVEFYNGATLLGSTADAPYAFLWPNVAVGSYSITARAYGSNGTTTDSAPVAVTVTAVAAPVVALTSPTAGASFTAPATVAIAATATTTQGTITKVEFYNGATLLGTSAAAPYAFSWTNVAAGSYSITAKAYGSNGTTTDSTTVSISVSAPSAPAVALTSPTAGASFTAAATVAIAATATTTQGTITKVEFYNGASLLATANAAPYAYSWTNVAPGSYTITAKAYGSNGTTTDSAAASITVATPASPVVALTSPAAGANFTAPATVAIAATATTTQGTITKVEFYNGATLLATANAAPYAFSWTNVGAGSYTITAKAYGSNGTTTDSAAASITVATPASPVVALTSPATGATFTAPATVAISATATTTQGTIAKVEFYNGATLLATANAAPYAFSWTNVSAGSYTITAKAYGSNGTTTDSAAASITVATPASPVVALTSPATGATFTAPATVAISATATTTQGTIAKVEFYNGASLLATANAAPYAFSWANVGAGSYTITAKAYGSNGTTATSTAATIAVTAPAAPTVGMTSPANGASYVAPASIPLSAVATTTQGTITKVEFYNGAALLATAASAPYAYSWTNVPAGTYTISAIAYGSNGTTATSTPVTITVTAVVAPVATLTAPANGASYTAPASIPITATATTTQGTITKVEFYNGAALLSTAATAPYTYTWANVAAGSYTITAKAYGSNGTSTTTTAAAVSVTTPSVGTAETGHWTLDSVTGGVTPDISGSNNPATVSGGFAAVTGVVGQGIQLDAATGGILTQRSVIDPTKSFTVSLWVNLANTTGTQTFVSLPANSVSNFYLQLGGWLNGAFVLDMYPQDSTGANDYVAAGTTIPVINKWYHVVGVYDATLKQIRLYVNGQQEGLGLAPVGGFANGGPLAFGYSKYAGTRHDGNNARMDDIRVFTGALTAAQIQQLYDDVTSLTRPTVALTSPAPGASYTPPATIALSATAAATQGTITKVEFYSGATLLGTAAAAPYTYNWTNVPAGTYALVARAYASNGTTTDSAVVSVTVAAPPAPVVAISSPANGANYIAPAAIPLAATATTTQGTITKVEFYNGAALLGTAPAAPYTYNWTNVAIGSYLLTAKAYGSNGTFTSSSSIGINVTAAAAPAVAITAPAGGTAFVAPATIPITASATTSQGTITKVEFYNGAALLGTATAAPYTYSWANVPVGAYAITAKAYGSNGTSATSPAVSVTVSAASGGLVEAGHWPLDAVTGGLTADTSGNNNPGTVAGAYNLVAGTIGQGIQLNPNVGGILTQRGVIDPTKSFTVALWVNLASASGTQTFVSLPANSVSNFYLQLGGWLNGAFVLDMYPQDSTGASDYVAAGTTKPVANKWYHVTGVYDATLKQIKIYVNGQQEGLAAAPAGGFANSGPLAFGYSKYAGSRYDGNDARLDDIRVFPSALTAAEILTVYNSR